MRNPIDREHDLPLDWFAEVFDAASAWFSNWRISQILLRAASDWLYDPPAQGIAYTAAVLLQVSNPVCPSIVKRRPACDHSYGWQPAFS